MKTFSPRGPHAAPTAREQLVDEMIDGYVHWREECFAVTSTYRNWSYAAAADRGLTYAAHVAALDREELAATIYGRLLRRVASEERPR